jgi:hypothetical protein
VKPSNRKGSRTPTASRQASRHKSKDALLLHSWFRLESAHRSSTCLRLITFSLIDDMTSCSSLISITYTGLFLEYWCLSLDEQKRNMPSLAARACSMNLTSASWLRPVCGCFYDLIRFICVPFFASCRRHRVLTVTYLKDSSPLLCQSSGWVMEPLVSFIFAT